MSDFFGPVVHASSQEGKLFYSCGNSLYLHSLNDDPTSTNTLVATLRCPITCLSPCNAFVAAGPSIYCVPSLMSSSSWVNSPSPFYYSPQGRMGRLVGLCCYSDIEQPTPLVAVLYADASMMVLSRDPHGSSTPLYQWCALGTCYAALFNSSPQCALLGQYSGKILVRSMRNGRLVGTIEVRKTGCAIMSLSDTITASTSLRRFWVVAACGDDRCAYVFAHRLEGQEEDATRTFNEWTCLWKSTSFGARCWSVSVSPCLVVAVGCEDGSLVAQSFSVDSTIESYPLFALPDAFPIRGCSKVLLYSNHNGLSLIACGFEGSIRHWRVPKDLKSNGKGPSLFLSLETLSRKRISEPTIRSCHVLATSQGSNVFAVDSAGKLHFSICGKFGEIPSTCSVALPHTVGAPIVMPTCLCASKGTSESPEFFVVVGDKAASLQLLRLSQNREDWSVDLCGSWCCAVPRSCSMVLCLVNSLGSVAALTSQEMLVGMTFPLGKSQGTTTLVSSSCGDIGVGRATKCLAFFDVPLCTLEWMLLGQKGGTVLLAQFKRCSKLVVRGEDSSSTFLHVKELCSIARWSDVVDVIASGEGCVAENKATRTIGVGSRQYIILFSCQIVDDDVTASPLRVVCVGFAQCRLVALHLGSGFVCLHAGRTANEVVVGRDGREMNRTKGVDAKRLYGVGIATDGSSSSVVWSSDGLKLFGITTRAPVSWWIRPPTASARDFYCCCLVRSSSREMGDGTSQVFCAGEDSKAYLYEIQSHSGKRVVVQRIGSALGCHDSNILACCTQTREKRGVLHGLDSVLFTVGSKETVCAWAMCQVEQIWCLCRYPMQKKSNTEKKTKDEDEMDGAARPRCLCLAPLPSNLVAVGLSSGAVRLLLLEKEEGSCDVFDGWRFILVQDCWPSLRCSKSMTVLPPSPVFCITFFSTATVCCGVAGLNDGHLLWLKLQTPLKNTCCTFINLINDGPAQFVAPASINSVVFLPSSHSSDSRPLTLLVGLDSGCVALCCATERTILSQVSIGTFCSVRAMEWISSVQCCHRLAVLSDGVVVVVEVLDDVDVRLGGGWRVQPRCSRGLAVLSSSMSNEILIVGQGMEVIRIS